ncbi:PadR family transcriptional regulator [Deinococcus irradiatisoli]|uniref:PadR family transcriptional regulator n=1 Tax=Deinococcus irradiatisoli TaxID=2202254 RepID=UPI001C63E8FB|nr:helix-turn-helix transcriptional regulator [Deinococcus irradiatisoli]
MTGASPSHANDANLGPSAFIVLGLLSQYGPGTSYDLKQWADLSVGYFWTFARSQLYAEPQRLTRLGLLEERQEQSGRRRRVYQVTPAGRAALQSWLGKPAGFPELRDLGLLKLFFAEQGPPENVRQLAAEQLALHQARLAAYEAICQGDLPDGMTAEDLNAAGSHTLRMGLLYERANIAFWSELLG